MAILRIPLKLLAINTKFLVFFTFLTFIFNSFLYSENSSLGYLPKDYTPYLHKNFTKNISTDQTTNSLNNNFDRFPFLNMMNLASKKDEKLIITCLPEPLINKIPNIPPTPSYYLRVYESLNYYKDKNLILNQIALSHMNPAISAFAAQLSCSKNVLNDDGCLQLSEVVADDLHQLSLVNTPDNAATCIPTSGCIGGNVFEDFNCNGTDDSHEPGVKGIQVSIYDYQNNAIDTVYTDSIGDYQLCGLTDGSAYRVEFVLPESISYWAMPTHVGADNSSDIQFVTAPACTQFSVSNPADYCQENPPLSVVCYLQPVDATSTDWTNEPAIVQIPYESGTTDMTSAGLATLENEAYMNTIATNGEVGSVFGLATDNKKDIIYSSSFMKRHIPFGPNGPGAIYKIEGGTVSSFIDINSLLTGIPAGTDGHSPSGNNYQLDDIWDVVGKTSFGDLLITPDGTYLYTVTMTDSDRKLYRIAIPSNGSNPTVADIETFDLPSPSDCPSHPATGIGELNYNIRPGALHYEQGTLYVGLTCTAESSQNVNDLKGYVYSFDPNGNSFNGPLLTIPFNYDRKEISTFPSSLPGNYYPWNANQLTTTTIPAVNGDHINASYPMPWLININFSDEGCMVLGIADRFGHLSSGAHNPPAQLNGNSGGDILKACNLSGTWTLENNANDGINPATAGAGTAAGPNNGEFFFQENFESFHHEISNGGFAVFPGSEELVLGVYDPSPINGTLPGGSNTFDSGGLIYLNTADGSRTRSYMLFNRNDYPSQGFDKASATGGIVLNCNPAPLEIGNYVWCDSIENGIQDAQERGIDNIMVQLYSANGTLVGQDSTINGQYYFNQFNVDTTGIIVNGSGIATPVTAWSGMSYSTQYFIVFGSGQFGTNEFTVGSDTYRVTSMANTGSNDNIDSDVDGSSLTTGTLGARPDGLPFIDLITSAFGCGDHKYDMGVTCTPCPASLCLDQHLMAPTGDTYQMTWNQALNGWTSPPDDPAMYPFTQTLTIPNSTITVDVTLSHRPRDDNGQTTFSNYACPNICTESINNVDLSPLLGQDTVFRYFKKDTDNPVTMTMVFSEPILAYELGTGNSYGNTGAIILGAWDGPVSVDGSQNLDPLGASRVLPNPTFHANPGTAFFDSETDDPALEPTVNPFNHDDMGTYTWGTSGNITNPAPAPINYMAEYPSNGDAGDPIIGQVDGYYYNLTENTIREWMLVDYAGAQVRGISWQLFRHTAAFTTNLKAGTVTFADLLNNPEAGNRSAYMTPFQFQSTCPEQNYTICEDGSNSVDLVVDATVTTDVIWFNESNVQVGTGNILTVDFNTNGISDGTETFFYSGTDIATGCTGVSCCPIVVITETCGPCDIKITTTQASCTDNLDGTFTATYDLMLNWEAPPATGDLTLTLYGDGTLNTMTVPAATIASGTSTTLSAAFTVPADGNGSTGILAVFNNDLNCKDSIGFKAPIPCPNDVTTCTSTAGCIGGNVFEDFNCNGTDDSHEPGVQGIQVIIYDCQNNAVDTVYTDSEGDYQLCSLIDDSAYRVEFVLPEAISCWATPTHVGGDNGSDVQFVIAPACTKFSISSPNDYCQENPQIATTCYSVGTTTAPESVNDAAVIEFAYNSGALGRDFGSSNGGDPYTEEVTDIAISGMPDVIGTLNAEPVTVGASKIINSTIGEVGALLGLSYHKSSNTLLTSAYMKRFTGLPNGPSDVSLGTIYAIDRDNNPNAPISFFTANAGIDNHDYSNSALNSPNGDTNAGASVSKAGWGDIDLSEDGKTLYAINLFDKRIYAIPVNETGGVITAGTATLIEFPNFVKNGLCNSNDWAPGAVKIQKGFVYVSVMCTAETSQNAADLRYLVYKFPVSSTGPFTQVVDMANYERPSVIVFNHAWHPWITTTTIIDGTPNDTGDPNRYIYPQPWVSDIEFDDLGRIYLGIRNRTGDMRASFNDAGQPAYEYGDTPMGTPNTDGTFTMQANINTGLNPPYEFIDDLSTSGSEHFENDMGMIGTIRGTGQLFVPATIGNLIQGMRTYDVSTTSSAALGGSPYRYYGITKLSGTNTVGNPFGKIANLGDIEPLCAPAPLEIGNYIWCDSIENGIQDACERGISDIIVSLYDKNGVLIGQDSTINGQYYFNQFNVDTTGITLDVNGTATPATAWSGMSYSSQYFIVFGRGQFATDEFTVGGNTYGISSMVNTGSNDNIDSDVDGSSLTTGTLGIRPDGLPFIDMITSATGCGDHKYDFGLTCPEEVCEIPLIYEQCGCDLTACMLTIQQVYANSTSCTGGTTGTIDMNVVVNYVNAPAGDIDINGTIFTPSSTNGIDTFLLIGIPCLDKDEMDVVAKFVNHSSCRDSVYTGLETVNPRYDDLGWDCEDNSGSQVFSNWMATGINVTISHSDNMFDGVPNIYNVNCPNGNNDNHCLSEYHGALRYTNNRNSIAGQPRGTATGKSFVKYAFDQPVFIEDFFLGSLSVLAGNTSEWVHIMAYDTTGALTFPSSYSTGAENCTNTGDLIPINVIPSSDCSIYAAGVSDGTNAGDKIYGHLKLSYSNIPVDSIVVEFWGSSNNYTDPEGAHSTRSCSSTINTGIFKPATCGCCPEIKELTPTHVICSGESIDTLAVTTTFESPDSIAFVYFTSAQTDSAVIYTAGTGIDTIPITSNNDTVRLLNVNGFTNTGNMPDTFYIYGIAFPVPSNPSCRPYQEILVIVNACDWGDLPDTSALTNAGDYQTSNANNGPSHVIIPGLSLGSNVDSETDGQASTNALGDGIDEDGLTIFESLDISPNSTFRLPFNYTNTTGSTAYIEVWIDWNGDGDFDDTNEMVIDLFDAGSNAYDRLEFNVPNGAVTEQFLGLRIRISLQDNMTPYGKINSGEIEDYLIGLDCPTQICLPTQIGN